MTRVVIEQTFDTLEEACKVGQIIYANYPPTGYGTELWINYDTPGKFILKGHRYDSAD